MEYEPDPTCFSVGIIGNCGLDCPVLLRGDCETEKTMLADVVVEKSPIDYMEITRGIVGG